MRTFATVALLVFVVACTPQPGGRMQPAGSTPSGSTAQPVTGRAVAGPTCPVEPASPAPGQCEPKPVAGATLVITASHGTRVATVTTGQDGSWQASLEPGRYTVTPQPVTGMMGGGAPVDFSVKAGEPTEPVVVEYDTGIR